MTLLRRVVFLNKLKDELIEKTKHHSSSDSQKIELHKQLHKIDLELQNIVREKNDSNSF